MLFVKKLPWASLLLLLFTYGVFGWLISTEAQSKGLDSLPELSRLIWLIGGVILLLALTLTAPFKVIQGFYTGWLKSDTKAFFSVILGAFIAVIIINWIQISIRILVLLSAGALVRLDLKTAGYSKWQSFGILIVVSLAGFSLGIVSNQLLEPKVHALSLIKESWVQ